jgi:hypothetical protein
MGEGDSYGIVLVGGAFGVEHAFSHSWESGAEAPHSMRFALFSAMEMAIVMGMSNFEGIIQSSGAFEETYF